MKALFSSSFKKQYLNHFRAFQKKLWYPTTGDKVKFAVLPANGRSKQSVTTSIYCLYVCDCDYSLYCAAIYSSSDWVFINAL